MSEFDVIGQSVQRYDAYDKVTGRTRYVGDKKVPGALYAKILHSPVAHARITRIDTAKAKALPGVAGVYTYEDVPDIPYTSCGHPFPFDTPLDQYILNRHVRYVGDTIAAVAAETPEIAAKAVRLIEFEYEELPAVFTVEDALKEDAYEIHEGSHNIAGENEYEIGDTAKAFAEAAYIFEDEIDTPIVTHAQMETHISLAEEESGTGRIILYASNQVPNIMRERIAYALGRPMRDIRVIKGAVGGGFGGKQEPVFEIVNCFLVSKLHKPVFLDASREENLAMTRTRHAMQIRLRSALDADYRFIGREVTILSNTGAYASHGHNVVFNQATQAGMLYPTANLKFSGKSVYTNILVAGAMRAYGIPQWAFAMESHVENIANALGLDPVAFRKLNAYKEGDPVYMDFMHVNSCALPQLLAKGSRDIGWAEFKQAEALGTCGAKMPGPKKRGIGMAIASYGQSCFPHSAELSVCRCQVHEDGYTTIASGSADIGQGTDTVLRQIAAETLGIPVEWVRILREVDTDSSPFDPGAYASRQCYVTGMAMKNAALKCKEDILDWASETTLQRPKESLDIRMGFLIDSKTKETLCSVEKVTREMYYGHPAAHPCVHEGYHYPVDNSLSFCTAWAIVTVDVETGEVEVEKLLTYLDCGTVLNPQTAIGQLYGGAAMSYGYGLTEQILIDPKTGRVYNDNLLDYKVPTMADFPDVEGLFIESYEPTSAYGNKSMGEPPNICPAIAIRNAVVNATGVRMNRLPLTPERVWENLHPEDGKPQSAFNAGHEAGQAAEDCHRGKEEESCIM